MFRLPLLANNILDSLLIRETANAATDWLKGLEKQLFRKQFFWGKPWWSHIIHANGDNKHKMSSTVYKQIKTVNPNSDIMHVS